MSGTYFAGDAITVVLDLQVWDPEAEDADTGRVGSFVADTDPGEVSVALLSADETTLALEAVTAVVDETVPGRVSATWAAEDTAGLTPAAYLVDARRETGPVTYDRPTIVVRRGRPEAP